MKKTTPVLILALAAIVLMVVYSGSLKDFMSARTASRGMDGEAAQRLKLAEQYIKEGDLEAAKSELLKNIAQADFDEGTYYWLSIIYLREDDSKQAFGYAKKFVEKSTNSQLLTDMGSEFALRGFEKTAFACYGKVVNDDPKYIPAYIELGKLYGNQDKFVQAISVWQDALKLDPDNAELKELITQGNALMEQGQKEN